MAIRKSLELKGDTILFNVYKVVNDKLVQVSELPQLNAGDINLEMTFNHIERDEFTIDFKNYNQFNVLKNIFNGINDDPNYVGNDIVLELVLYNEKIGGYQPINLYYMTSFNEVYNGNSEWEVSISGTDWKGFIEERRYVLHNVIDPNPDNPDFDKVRFTLSEKINDVFFALIYDALKTGKNISKGEAPKISNDRKVNILNNMYFKLKEDITIPNYLQDKCYIAEFRKQWCDMCFGDLIDWAYTLDRPKVTTKKNNGMIDLYYNQQGVHFVNYKNTKDVINKLEIINDKIDYKNNACVYSQEKDAISYQLNGIKSKNRIATFDAEITEAGYNQDNFIPKETLISKAQQQINTKSNTYKFNADIELAGLPLVDWAPGDIVSFKNFPLSINGAFEITSIQLSANHDNGYLEFKINETLERPNVFREQYFLEN